MSEASIRPGPIPTVETLAESGAADVVPPDRTVVAAIWDWLPATSPEVKVSVTSVKNWTGGVVAGVVESMSTRVQSPLIWLAVAPRLMLSAVAPPA